MPPVGDMHVGKGVAVLSDGHTLGQVDFQSARQALTGCVQRRTFFVKGMQKLIAQALTSYPA